MVTSDLVAGIVDTSQPAPITNAAARARGSLAIMVRQICAAGAPNLLVAIAPLALLVPFLRLHRKRRDRARFQPLERDRLARLLAIAVGIVLDALQCRIDLGDQLALPVASAQLDGAVCLRRGAVGEVRMIDVLLLKRLQRDPRFPQDLVL